MSGWYRLSRSECLRLNRLLQRAQKHREEARLAWARQHPEAQPKPMKELAQLHPAVIVDLSTGAWYAPDRWLDLDERQYALYFYVSEELAGELQCVCQRNERKREKEHERYARLHPRP